MASACSSCTAAQHSLTLQRVTDHTPYRLNDARAEPTLTVPRHWRGYSTFIPFDAPAARDHSLTVAALKETSEILEVRGGNIGYCPIHHRAASPLDQIVAIA
jgi:hypothetical protein